MRISPRGIAIVYFLMGALFIYIAINSVTDTVWNTLTIIFTIVATLDFIVGFRYWRMHLYLKKHNKKK
ncbi:YdiK family protein [Virgibacillus alimentarius]|uniref:Heme/copper-type cytochrome/quinol oxidase subunit 4 n=1 Tax=Virgibacillus alimentarius TaxID=698769 RepID=A0ABS4SFB4_9BACI|nr:YdiK family protein [Virgibacillus alimentarius]MBP2259042.1 heme/copper-type cytochrome/quinol oxidase subunit 4 [Virgibacillus alimentarius]